MTSSRNRNGSGPPADRAWPETSSVPCKRTYDSPIRARPACTMPKRWRRGSRESRPMLFPQKQKHRDQGRFCREAVRSVFVGARLRAIGRRKRRDRGRSHNSRSGTGNNQSCSRPGSAWRALSRASTSASPRPRSRSSTVRWNSRSAASPVSSSGPWATAASAVSILAFLA